MAVTKLSNLDRRCPFLVTRSYGNVSIALKTLNPEAVSGAPGVDGVNVLPTIRTESRDEPGGGG